MQSTSDREKRDGCISDYNPRLHSLVSKIDGEMQNYVLSMMFCDRKEDDIHDFLSALAIHLVHLVVQVFECVVFYTPCIQMQSVSQ